MAITRLQAETLLVGPDMLSGRLGRRMVLAKLYDPDTAVLGAIPAVGAAIGEGLRSLGVYPSDPTDLTDIDLAGVSDAKLGQLLDVAELRGLESIVGNLDEIDEQDGTDRQDWTKFADHVLKAIAALRARLAEQYGVGLSRPSRPRAGSIVPGSAWPAQPPPPSSCSPYPTTPDPRAGRRRFNP